jgi:methyl-accepting chemotaxis protein
MKMNSMSLKIKLGHRIGSISVVVILGIAVIAGIYLYGAAFQDKADALGAINALAQKTHVALLEARRSEKDFLLRSDIKYAQRHSKQQEDVVGDIAALQQQSRSLGLGELAQKADAILDGFNKYGAQFKTLISAKTTLGLTENDGLEGALRKSVHNIETKLNALKEPKYLVSMLMMRRHEKDFMLRHNPKYGDDIKKRASELTAALDQSDLATPAKDEIKRNLSAYQRDFLAWMEGDLAVTKIQKEMSAAYAQIEPIIDGVLTSAEQMRADVENENRKSRADTKIRMLIGMLLIGLVVTGMTFWIGRGITKPIQAFVGPLNQVANGNFAIVVPGLDRSDEIGQIAAAVAQMADKVRATIAQIMASGREVTNASAEISTSTTDLSQRTEEQAASLEETSAAMEELSATVKKNAENAQHANQSAKTTSDVAGRGGQVVASAVEAMAKIEESSRKISDIIGVIDEIARQTNLLALNAAVEAARAGEAGRGFAVVASEVRSLAQRSSQAAKDIKDLITNSNSQVKDGVDLVNKAGESLSEIVKSIKEVAEVVAEIANASSEQATGIEQINKALTQMDDATQQNSALVEENAATAKTLEHQAKAMDEQIAYFQIGDGANGERRAAPANAGDRRPEAVAASRGPAAKPRQQPVAAPKRAAAGGSNGGARRMQTALATAVNADTDWKEF